jgi:hypothetical protein
MTKKIHIQGISDVNGRGAGLDLKLQSARVRGARHHVSKQRDGSGTEVEAEPSFQHPAQRGDRQPAQ